ncbi:uncharacterized protein THITE_2119958 [Thermothielavioides terrestris NRRL 8126]|uniref:TRUD domain-containing protein n=1 Tax=Thermothielavioides terrestris (strain ATCC 38088 / NRRL 8126) TaxID=578455 RepID=G2R988_THETT|nr:uncharacterized protein THITE_2119958 [Thermothielavioides terrestris NRRL 8126]AEO69486.1 hypothetical protein THITE_2119958 [Thermothielavioides terrestris NRRL 8126]
MSQRPGTHVPAVRAEAEKALGITQRSAAINFAWTGDIRKRFTDFLVNEIRKDGTVLHLRDYPEEDTPRRQPALDRKASTPSSKPENKAKVHHISEEDRKIVVDLLGESAAQRLIELDENVQAKKPMAAKERTVAFDPVTDRAKRGIIHQEIRRIFQSRIDTAADAAGVISATATKWSNNSRASNRTSNRGPNRTSDRTSDRTADRTTDRASDDRAASQNWGARRDNSHYRDQARDFSELGGEYLHFTLYKENKDTMDAVNTIARLLKIKASNFGFAGTKDRRASTVQRISVYRQRISNLVWLNSRISNVKVGDFEYSPEPLQLGQHGGNEFVITLKNCMPLGGSNCSIVQRMKMIQQAVECGLAYLKHHGYINYYGLQRFGTHAIGTHLLGMKILQGDYEGVIDDILHVEEDLIKEVLSNATQPSGPGKDSQNSRDEHNRARGITTWKATKNAAQALEFLPKRYSSETAIIRHLGKNPKDFTGAVLSITRGMRMMYVHAYQSYVWNFVATRRWSKYGAKVIEGDLVLVGGTRRRESQSDDEFNPYDDNDEDNIYAQAHALTAAEVASGKYTIFDVVLPTPGYDVTYPRNDIGEYYVEFMGKPENGALNPYEMRRKQREFSLSGNYRPLLGRLIGDPQYAIRAYHDDTQQLYPTDLDYAHHKKNAEKLAKAAARAEPNAAAAGADSMISRWAHFALNPTAYDDALAAQRRRKADQEPPSPSVLVTNETWVQTGVNGGAKRVKLARHQQQIETPLDTGVSGDNTSPTVEAPAVEAPAVQVIQAEGPEEDAGRPACPVGNGATLTDNPRDTTPPRIITGGPIPMISLPKGAIPTSGIRGVSDAYYASTGQIPYFGPLPADFKFESSPDGLDAPQGQQRESGTKQFEASGLSQHSDGSVKIAGNETNGAAATTEDQQSLLPVLSETTLPEAPVTWTKPKLLSTVDWYGADLPQLPSVSENTTNGQSDGTSMALVKVEEPDNAPGDTELINNVPVPKLRTASNNPLSSVGNGIDENSIDPEASKIAVILKFQLKASNYATIVLRELMGTTAEERAL